MQKLRIGIVDKEEDYVTKLSAYLQSYGKGQWDLIAFTEEKVLFQYLEQKKINILIGTEKKILLRYSEYNEMVCIWLTNEKQTDGKEKYLHVVYRYQSARKIAKQMEQISYSIEKDFIQDNRMIAIYSPVGRCGKTTLALNIVENEGYGRLLYIGMEDYGSFLQNMESKETITDELLYYWRERKKEKILSAFKEIEKIAVSGTSMFDSKEINAEDIKWMRIVLQESEYKGIVLDIGSGVLQSLHIFHEFDVVIVPYLEEKAALVKKENFINLLRIQGVKDWEERVHFINMDGSNQIDKRIQEIIR